MEDIYEVQNIEGYEDTLSPLDWADKQFNEIYHRNWKLYLNSIEWDTWCTKLTAEEILAQEKQREIETHPFKNFF